MKSKKIFIFSSILVLFLIMGSSRGLQGDTTLNVPECIQEYSNWCWAGSSQAVLAHYLQYPNQCEIANFAWNKSVCCNGSTDFYDRVYGCNRANFLYGSDGSIEGILGNWGVDSYGSDTYLSWAECVSELDNSYPFVMRFGWTTGGGHFLVAYGYISSGSYLKYMDPWPGEGYTTSLYTYVVSSTDHDWTHTLTTY
jgi:hypothetical protein